MVQSKIRNRIWEIDFVRGIALLLMIYFHIIYDMKEIFNYEVSYEKGINSFIGEASGILFILISGISCTLARNNITRGLRVLGIALAITLITHLYDPHLGIKFGILHFLGISMLLYNVFYRLNKYLLILFGTLIITLGYVITDIKVTHDYFFVLGIHSSSFNSSDYYPLIPWLGLFLYGNALGKMLYTKKKSIFNFTVPENIISKVGRKTLFIYLIHQPLIVFALTVVEKVF